MFICKAIDRTIFELIPSLYFNFRYLPLRQAIKLPIVIRKPKLIKFSGRVVIDACKLYRGMITLGRFGINTYPDCGIQIHNEGVITFKGRCTFTNASSISIGESGSITVGDNAACGPVRIVSRIGIELGEYVRLGWGVTVMDTNFHPLYDMERGEFKKAYGKIKIGDYNWISQQCLVLHSVVTPTRSIFGAKSVISRGCKFESFSLHGGSPLRVLSRNVMRDYDNDQIDDYI